MATKHEECCDLFDKIFADISKVGDDITYRIKSYYVFEYINGKQNVIFVTNDDEVYMFEGDRYNENNKKNFINHNIVSYDAKRVEKSEKNGTKIEELCNKRIVKFSGGSLHVLALSSGGNVFAWGNNSWGQLANNTTVNCYVPKKIQTLNNIIDISCGNCHSLALSAKGKVFAFGNNNYGQSGKEFRNKVQLMPKSVKIGMKNEKTVAIKCGNFHSVALTDSNEVYAWGLNDYGQLGINSVEKQFMPHKVVNLNNVRVKQIECGWKYTLMLSYDGEVYACGSNEFGQLGVGYQSRCETTVKKVNINKKIRRIFANYFNYFSFALTETENSFIWGRIRREETYCEPKLIEFKFKAIEDAIYYYSDITFENINRIIESKTFEINNYIDSHEEVKFIASGGFGFVFKAKSKFDNNFYAIKKIPLINANDVNSLRNELELMQNLKSDFAVKMNNYWIEDNYYCNKTLMTNLKSLFSKDLNNIFLHKSFISRSSNLFHPNFKHLLHIQMELCVKSLKDVMQELKDITLINYFIESQLFVQIVEAVNYLHKQTPKIIHRDLKPQNILICKPINGRFVKLADFGETVPHEYTQQLHTQERGTMRYMAPEVCDSSKYNEKCDVYSLAIIAKELFNVVNDSRREQYEIKYTELKELIAIMKCSDTRVRPNCEQILSAKHLWAIEWEDIEDDNEFGRITSQQQCDTIEENFVNYFINYRNR